MSTIAATMDLPIRFTPARSRPRGKFAAILVSLVLTIGLIQVADSHQANAASFSRRWFGAQVQLSRHETNLMIFGTAGAAAISLAIPDPTLSKVVAAGLGIFAGWANYIYNEGQCAEFNVTWWGGVYPWSYSGGYCR